MDIGVFVAALNPLSAEMTPPPEPVPASRFKDWELCYICYTKHYCCGADVASTIVSGVRVGGQRTAFMGRRGVCLGITSNLFETQNALKNDMWKPERTQKR